MKELPKHCANLNIWYYLPEAVWDKVVVVYQSMPGWIGYNQKGIPYRFGTEEEEKSISASVEPSGLQLCAKMETQEWHSWLRLFKEIATKELGFTVGEPEDGFK